MKNYLFVGIENVEIKEVKSKFTGVKVLADNVLFFIVEESAKKLKSIIDEALSDDSVYILTELTDNFIMNGCNLSDTDLKKLRHTVYDDIEKTREQIGEGLDKAKQSLSKGLKGIKKGLSNIKKDKNKEM